MAKEVDLLSYWMPVIKQIKEFKEIAKAEEPELRYLLEAIDRTLNGMFIETADEYGIKRFEEMLGIIPEEGDTLSVRRYRVLAKWSNTNTYTIKELREILISYCGADNLEIIERYDEYMLEIIASLPVKGSLEIVRDLLEDIIPCNLVISLKNKLQETASPTAYIGGAVSTYMIYDILCAERREDNKITAEIPLHSATAGSIGVIATITTVKI